jgi:hypothetical protein
MNKLITYHEEQFLHAMDHIEADIKELLSNGKTVIVIDEIKSGFTFSNIPGDRLGLFSIQVQDMNIEFINECNENDVHIIILGERTTDLMKVRGKQKVFSLLTMDMTFMVVVDDVDITTVNYPIPNYHLIPNNKLTRLRFYNTTDGVCLY